MIKSKLMEVSIKNFPRSLHNKVIKEAKINQVSLKEMYTEIVKYYFNN